MFGEVGYKIRTEAAVFEPFAALAYVHLDSDGFAETGGAAALSLDGQSDDATFTTLGARATTGLMLGSMAARAHASLAWQHAFADPEPLTTMALAGGNGFTVGGAPFARDLALLSLGLDMDVTETTVLGVSYGGQFGDGTTSHQARLDLSVRF
ncbi:outer membrane autotransporter protein [Hoeflea marina]|uniref:Outer membrane autotransporter protein n=1 Tax=Hoeflea marina TaxID=274592 RepID=A0A317PRK8_9HYPH|nr:outer membrane autotransporter protein [Hoeflea marina]